MLQLPESKANLALYVLGERGETIEDYDGWCGNVAELVLKQYEGQMIYVDGDALFWYGWSYHMVPLIDGKIHDAWFGVWETPEPLSLNEWLVRMFGTEDEINVTVNGDDVYSGLPQNFVLNPIGRGLTLAH